MSCVIVSVCSALLVAMNHVTLYIVYIQLSERARVRVYTRARVRDMCVRAYVRECLYVCSCAQAWRLLYCCILLGVRMCARRRNTTICACAYTSR